MVFCITAYGLGCFRDTGRRAISTLEGRSRLLKGNYRRRRYAIQKCAGAALRRDYRVFAIQHQGWCASARYAYRTYRRYGISKRCRKGKGGPWANDVYVLRGKLIYGCVPLVYLKSFSGKGNYWLELFNAVHYNDVKVTNRQNKFKSQKRGHELDHDQSMYCHWNRTIERRKSCLEAWG